MACIPGLLAMHTPCCQPGRTHIGHESFCYPLYAYGPGTLIINFRNFRDKIGKIRFWDFWICGKCILGHFEFLKFSTKFWNFEISTNFSYIDLYIDRTIHIFSYVDLYMDRAIHVFSYVALYMDRTIHIFSYVDPYVDRTIHIFSYVDVSAKPAFEWRYT